MIFKDNIIICTITESEIRLEKDSKIYHRHKLIGKPIEDGEIVDSQSFSYQLLKVLGKIKKNTYLYINITLISNVFRRKKLYNIKKDEIDAYLKYNIGEIFPYRAEEYVFNYIFQNNNLYLFGIRKDFIDTINELLNEEGFRNVIVFPSILPIIKEFEKNSVNNCYLMNIEKNMLEFVLYRNKEINYFSISLKYIINYIDFDMDALENQLKIGEVKKIFSKLIQNFNLDDEKGEEIYLFGDRDLVPIWEIILSSSYSSFTFKNIEYKFDNKLSKSTNFYNREKKNYIKLLDRQKIAFVLSMLILCFFIYRDNTLNNKEILELNNQLTELTKINTELSNTGLSEIQVNKEKVKNDINYDLYKKFKRQEEITYLIDRIIDNQSNEIYVTRFEYNYESFVIEGHSIDKSSIDEFMNKISTYEMKFNLQEILDTGNYYAFKIIMGDKDA